jgi:hypothetical protein
MRNSEIESEKELILDSVIPQKRWKLDEHWDKEL